MRVFLQVANSPYTHVLVTDFLALVLLSAAITKFTDRASFLRILEEYRLLPPRVGRVVARILPYFELALAFLSLASLAALWTATAMCALFGAFATAVAINLLRGRYNISCGCFGFSTEQRLSWGIVSRNAGFCFLALLAGGWFDPSTAASEPRSFAQIPAPEMIGSALTACGVLCVWWLSVAL